MFQFLSETENDDDNNDNNNNGYVYRAAAVEPRYNEDHGTQKNYLVISGISFYQGKMI